jgi:hypothetical protein
MWVIHFTYQEFGSRMLVNGPDKQQPSTKEKALDLAREVRAFASHEMRQAEEERSLANWLRAEHYSQVDLNHYKWIFDLGSEFSGYCFDNFRDDEFFSEKTQNKFNKLASNCQVIFSKIRDIEEGEIALSLKRIRAESNRGEWNYLTLAKFGDQTDCVGYRLYCPGGVACAEHACDVLYKSMKEQQSPYYRLPYKSSYQHCREAYQTEPLIVEYQDVAAEIGAVAGAEREVSRALVGYYSNLHPIRLPSFIEDL